MRRSQDLKKVFDMVPPATGLSWESKGMGPVGCSVALEERDDWESHRSAGRGSMDEVKERLGDVRNRLGIRGKTGKHLGDGTTCLDNGNDQLVGT